jgi:hypothetical protein
MFPAASLPTRSPFSMVNSRVPIFMALVYEAEQRWSTAKRER